MKPKRRNALSPSWQAGRGFDNVDLSGIGAPELLPALATLNTAPVEKDETARAPRRTRKRGPLASAKAKNEAIQRALVDAGATSDTDGRETVLADFSEPVTGDPSLPVVPEAPIAPEALPETEPVPQVSSPARTVEKKEPLFRAEEAVSPPPVAPEMRHAVPQVPVSRRPRRSGGDLFAYIAAIALATVAGYFSVSGMAEIFPGAPFEVMVLATTMEAGKLVIVGWLAAHWRESGWRLRMMLTVLVLGLALINSVGVFGKLVEAHIGVVTKAQSSVTEKLETMEVRINAQATTVADIDRRIAQIDSAIDEATRRGRVNAAMTLAEQKRRDREALVAQRAREATTLTDLRSQRAAIGGERAHADAAAGPVRYLATLAGTDTETAVRWLIVLMVLCCDPAAIALTIAAAGRKTA